LVMLNLKNMTRSKWSVSKCLVPRQEKMKTSWQLLPSQIVGNVIALCFHHPDNRQFPSCCTVSPCCTLTSALFMCRVYFCRPGLLLDRYDQDFPCRQCFHPLQFEVTLSIGRQNIPRRVSWPYISHIGSIWQVRG
jgi:hypothetical protein